MRSYCKGDAVKLAIMQPYFFPYIGYWQLIHAVDMFVIYDDVNYIKGGWINRNRILVNRREHMLTLPLVRPSPNKLINEINLSAGREKLAKTVAMAYGKAPHFSESMPMIEDILLNSTSSLSRFLEYSIRQVCSFLGIEARIVLSSDIEKDNALRGQDKILDMCGRLGAKSYINSIGGQTLYDADAFKARGIDLKFIQTNPIEYIQFGNLSIPSLSIIDVLMFYSRDQVRECLEKCRIHRE